MGHVVHWETVEAERNDEPAHLRATWRDLGRAAEAVGASVQRVEIEPGCRNSPVHQHAVEEEYVFGLGGSGFSWQDGALHPIAAGDVVLHRADAEAHTLLAGDDGLDVLIFGPEPVAPVSFLPRAGVMRAGGAWVDFDPASPHPFLREPAELGGRPAGARPPTICALEDVDPETTHHPPSDFTERDLGRHLGSVTTGLAHVTIAAGAEGWPPHCHSAEEELFVVLDGEGTVVLGDEAVPVRRGTCVARPAGSRVAHHFTGPVTYLAWGPRIPPDVVWYPRTRKVNVRGIGVMFRADPLGYWD